MVSTTLTLGGQGELYRYGTSRRRRDTNPVLISFWPSEIDDGGEYRSTSQPGQAPHEETNTAPVQTPAEEQRVDEVGTAAQREAPDPRYAGLDLDWIRGQLTPELFEIFMDTVGTIEMPLEWTEQGKPIYFGDGDGE